ncbi:MAG TPA: hypothetical protein VN578_07895 [Candidatus Binatia bacterium]|jgi:hypothetical protein|nr:hypothetical protein [Candidatus Binatia bacterium]
MTRFRQNIQAGLALSPEREWTQTRDAAWAFLARYRQHAFKAFRRISNVYTGEASRPAATPAQANLGAVPEAALSRCGALPLIAAKVELGPGHAVFIRGEGGGPSWHRGLPLDCIAPGSWIWFATGLAEKIVFQLLLNDAIWARGDKLVLEPGNRLELAPDFEWPEIPRTA